MKIAFIFLVAIGITSAATPATSTIDCLSHGGNLSVDDIAYLIRTFNINVTTLWKTLGSNIGTGNITSERATAGHTPSSRPLWNVISNNIPPVRIDVPQMKNSILRMKNSTVESTLQRMSQLYRFGINWKSIPSSILNKTVNMETIKNALTPIKPTSMLTDVMEKLVPAIVGDESNANGDLSSSTTSSVSSQLPASTESSSAADQFPDEKTESEDSATPATAAEDETKSNIVSNNTSNSDSGSSSSTTSTVSAQLPAATESSSGADQSSEFAVSPSLGNDNKTVAIPELAIDQSLESAANSSSSGAENIKSPASGQTSSSRSLWNAISSNVPQMRINVPQMKKSILSMKNSTVESALQRMSQLYRIGFNWKSIPSSILNKTVDMETVKNVLTPIKHNSMLTDVMAKLVPALVGDNSNADGGSSSTTTSTVSAQLPASPVPSSAANGSSGSAARSSSKYLWNVISNNIPRVKIDVPQMKNSILSMKNSTVETALQRMSQLYRFGINWKSIPSSILNKTVNMETIKNVLTPIKPTSMLTDVMEKLVPAIVGDDSNANESSSSSTTSTISSKLPASPASSSAADQSSGSAASSSSSGAENIKSPASKQTSSSRYLWNVMSNNIPPVRINVPQMKKSILSMKNSTVESALQRMSQLYRIGFNWKSIPSSILNKTVDMETVKNVLTPIKHNSMLPDVMAKLVPALVGDDSNAIEDTSSSITPTATSQLPASSESSSATDQSSDEKTESEVSALPATTAEDETKSNIVSNDISNNDSGSSSSATSTVTSQLPASTESSAAADQSSDENTESEVKALPATAAVDESETNEVSNDTSNIDSVSSSSTTSTVSSQLPATTESSATAEQSSDEKTESEVKALPATAAVDEPETNKVSNDTSNIDSVSSSSTTSTASSQLPATTKSPSVADQSSETTVSPSPGNDNKTVATPELNSKIVWNIVSMTIPRKKVNVPQIKKSISGQKNPTFLSTLELISHLYGFGIDWKSIPSTILNKPADLETVKNVLTPMSHNSWLPDVMDKLVSALVECDTKGASNSSLSAKTTAVSSKISPASRPIRG